LGLGLGLGLGSTHSEGVGGVHIGGGGAHQSTSAVQLLTHAITVRNITRKA
jgi:hypothetical protein